MASPSSTSIEFQSYEEAQAENFRKMLLAMARDVRVILIKLADRLHNMRTLDAVRAGQAPPHRPRNAGHLRADRQPPGPQHALPRAAGPGLPPPAPAALPVLAKAVKAARGNRREVVGKILRGDQAAPARGGIEAEVMGREKHLYSIYRKMRDKHLSFSQVLDIYGFRVIVKDVPTCYLALGALHGLYKPVPGKFKDYIAIPKANGYQSLHTTLIGPYGTPVEVQIRTARDAPRRRGRRRLALALQGRAGADRAAAARPTSGCNRCSNCSRRSGDSAEFLEHVKVDLFPDEVYVFTPQGQDPGAAARRHGGGLRLRRAHRHRQPLRRLPDQLRD